jgi:hypothetical protein
LTLTIEEKEERSQRRADDGTDPEKRKSTMEDTAATHHHHHHDASTCKCKKNYGNANISRCKNIIFEKSSKRNQNPSRYYISITNLKF